MNIHKQISGNVAPKLKVENLSAGYGSKVVLRDVGMEVAPGEIRVILGSSGCGKSTLLKNIMDWKNRLVASSIFSDNASIGSMANPPRP